MLNINQFRELIVKSSLTDLLLYSQDAEELLIFTCAVESLGGSYLQQLNGTAIGIYQIEPVTYNDLWNNFIIHNNKIVLQLMNNFDVNRMPSEARIIYDLRFATAISRIFYRRIDESLPPADDVNAIWDYYKKYYNTHKGKSEKEESIRKYIDFAQLHYR